MIGTMHRAATGDRRLRAYWSATWRPSSQKKRSYLRRPMTSQAMRPITATTKMNLMANQITLVTKLNAANATNAAMTAPPINSTRSKVFSPDRSSLTVRNDIPPFNGPIGAPKWSVLHRVGGSVC